MSKETSLIRVRGITKARIESFGKFGETFDDVLSTIIYIIDKVGYRGLADTVGNRTIFPRIVGTEEENQLVEKLRAKRYETPLKTVKEIEETLKEEEEAEKE